MPKMPKMPKTPKTPKHPVSQSTDPNSFWLKERFIKAVKPKLNETVHIQVLGHRDPRGPDNNIRIWVDAQDQLHIRVEKANRCYQFKSLQNNSTFIDLVAE